MAEGARYNIGGLGRTINVPVLAFEVLRPTLQSRFQFTRGKRDKDVDPSVAVVAFREDGRPSFIRGPNDDDMPSSGRLWIDEGSGQVLQTELIVNTTLVRAEITTRFRFDPTFDVAIPVEMHEVYTQGRKPMIVGTAKYSRFRRFGVSVTSEVK
jgi:hypothetical protein